MSLRMNALFVSVLLAAAAFAGCATQETPGTPAGNGQGNDTVTGAAVALGTLPAGALAGTSVSLSWTVTAPTGAQVPHTAVHFGNVSHANVSNASLTATTYPFSTDYQMNSGAHTGFFVPWAPGTYYLRAHAVVNGTNVWGEEKTLTIAPNPQPFVAILGAPGAVAKGGPVEFKWIVSAPTRLPVGHTAVHYGNESHKDVPNAQLTATTYPNGTNSGAGYYRGNTTQQFTSAGASPAVMAPMTGDTLYFRGHAVVAGQQLWTPEYQVRLTG